MLTSPILLLHIAAGTLGLLSGTLAICARKGSRLHAQSGIVFSLAMLMLAATGVWLAHTRSQPGNILGGVLTFYMIATAWSAGRNRDGRTHPYDWIAFAAALTIGVGCVTYGYRVANGLTDGHGVSPGMDFFLGVVILLAAAGDIRMLARGGIAGTQRIARHLWRMCFGLFIASGSFFMGRERIFPDFIRRSNILIFLTILPLLLLLFWLVRIRVTRAYERKPLSRSDGDCSLPTQA